MKNKGLGILGYLVLLCGIILLVSSVGKIGEALPETSGKIPESSESSEDDVSKSYIGNESGGIVAEGDYAKMSLFSECAVAYNVTEGKYNLMKNASTTCAPGDFNLLMTALVAVDKLPSDYTFVVTNEIELVPNGSTLAGLKYGDILTLPMMLDALLVQHGADAAYSVAVSVAKKTSGDSKLSNEDAIRMFVVAMNSAASSMSMSNSNFTNPSGSYDLDQHTTAADMCKAALQAQKNALIAASVAKKSSSVTFNNGRSVSFTNPNKLLDSSYSAQYYTYATGMLYFSLSDKQHCLIATATIGTTDVISVLLFADTANDAYADAQTVFYPVLSKTVLPPSQTT